MHDRTHALAVERFLVKVNQDGPIPDYRPELGPCWIWKPLAQTGGYGAFYLGGRSMTSHRASYVLFVKPIPAGLVVDHLCRVRNCVRPDHLEPVTTAENTRRAEAWLAGANHQRSKTHCPYGHPYSGDNLHVAPDGKRICAECSRRWARESRARKRAANPLQSRAPKEFCAQGHSFAEHGSVVSGKRVCTECARQRVRAYRERRRAERAPDAPRVTCIHGHPWVAENIYTDPRGRKSCRTCHNSRTLARYHETKVPKAAKPLRTACEKGHPLTGDNAYVTPDGLLKCRECARARQRRYDAKRKAATPPKSPRTHCIRGHELAGDNLYVAPNGRKFCRKCTAIYQQRKLDGLAEPSPNKGRKRS